MVMATRCTSHQSKALGNSCSTVDGERELTTGAWGSMTHRVEALHQKVNEEERDAKVQALLRALHEQAHAASATIMTNEHELGGFAVLKQYVTYLTRPASTTAKQFLMPSTVASVCVWYVNICPSDRLEPWHMASTSPRAR